MWKRKIYFYLFKTWLENKFSQNYSKTNQIFRVLDFSWFKILISSETFLEKNIILIEVLP
jgi:hypothetical protein